MDEISLRIMTRKLCHKLYSGWENDPSIYADMKLFTAYRYDECAVDKYFDSKQNPFRVLFAIMKGGYGTRAEQLAVRYAFDVLGMVAVNADTIAKNTRSQHVLEKVGFRFIRQENGFKYYRYER